jgi:hypothetical protein
VLKAGAPGLFVVRHARAAVLGVGVAGASIREAPLAKTPRRQPNLAEILSHLRRLGSLGVLAIKPP